MIRFIVLITTIISGLGSARADSVAHVCNTAPNIAPITLHEACAGFVARDASGRQVSRVAIDETISGSIYASPDGRSVVMLHDYPRNDPKFASMPAVLIYRDGKRVASYAMIDLIQRMELIGESISHHSWIHERPKTLVLGKTLTLVTSSLRAIKIDTVTGALDARDTPLWAGCDVIAYAPIRLKPVNGVYTVAKPIVVKGTLPAGQVTFVAADGVTIPDRVGHALCLAPHARQGWTATAAVSVMWNAQP